jgi:hypothetical protein
MGTLYCARSKILKWNLKYYMNDEERFINTKNIFLNQEDAFNLIYLSIATNYPDEWNIIKKIDRKIMDNKLMMSYCLSSLENELNKYEKQKEINKDSFYDKDDKKMNSKYLH